MSKELPWDKDNEGLSKFINHIFAQNLDDNGLEVIEWHDAKNGHGSCQYRDLAPLAHLYTRNRFLVAEEVNKRLQVMIEWVKTLDRDPTTKTPTCVCGIVMTADCLEPENRDKFVEWAQYHRQHQLQRDEEIAKVAKRVFAVPVER